MVQDKIHKDYKDTPALWSMCWMNFWCSLYNCVYLFGVTSAGWDLLGFCREFPEVRSAAVPSMYHFLRHQCISCSIWLGWFNASALAGRRQRAFKRSGHA